MRSRSVIVLEIRGQDSTQRGLMEHDHMVQTLAPKRTNHSPYIRPLPRRSRCGQNFLDAHVCDLPLEFLAEDGVAITQQVARDLLKRKRLPQLLPGPLRGWMGSHIEMKNASTVDGQRRAPVAPNVGEPSPQQTV